MAEWIVEIGDGNPHIKKMIPLVRCKDCKWLDYCDTQEDAWTEEREYLCCREGFPVDLNDFCSCGEKVTE